MDVVGIVALVLATGVSLLIVPDIRPSDLIEPSVQAAIFTPVFLATLVALRVTNAPVARERALLAAFLFLMPTVYLASLALHGGTGAWLTTEAIGQVIFAGVAVVGWRRSAVVLAAGLVGHGVAWDAWHHGRTTFIPDWYTTACLVVDLGCGAYAASRVTAWGATAVRRSTVAPLARPHGIGA